MGRNKVFAFFASVALILASLILVACQGQQATPAAPTAAPAAPAPKPTSAPAAPTTAPAPAPTTAPATAPTTAPAAAPTAAPQIVKLGIAAPLTGRIAALGLNLDRMIRLGIAAVNEKGGFKVGDKTYRFESVTADDKYTSEGGREAANKLVLADKVKFVIGTSTVSTPGAQAITEPSKVLLIATSAVDRSLSKEFPFTIQVGSVHNRMRIAVLYDWLVKAHPNAKRVAVLVQDDASGQGYAETAVEFVQRKGLTLVAKEFVPADTKDFTPAVTRLLRQNPDAIDIGTTGANANGLLGISRALYEQGFKGPFFSTQADQTTWESGLPATQNFVASALIDHKDPKLSDKEKDAIKRFLAVYPESELRVTALGNFDAPVVLAQAMAKAGTVDDTEKIVQTMRAGEWDTLFGKRKFAGAKIFGLPQVIEPTIYLSQIVNGKIAVIDAITGTLD